MDKLILASGSKYRKQLLRAAGLDCETMSPDIDEDAYKAKSLAPKELAETLAEKKALATRSRLNPDQTETSIVIGSDQVACLGDEIFSKPGSFENAMLTLKKLNGQAHQLITSVCVLKSEQKIIFTNTTTLHMRNLAETELAEYLKFDQPYDCAGSYKLECGGIKLFEKIESSDFTAIQGLPMIELTTQLIKLGYKLL